MSNYIPDVRITELRYIKFSAYLSDFHGIPEHCQWVSLKAFYSADYVEFCETHAVNTEPNFDAEIFKGCLAGEGLAIYNEITALRSELKRDITEEQKQEIQHKIKRLREVEQ